jgi:hypothetical protein
VPTKFIPIPRSLREAFILDEAHESEESCGRRSEESRPTQRALRRGILGGFCFLLFGLVQRSWMRSKEEIQLIFIATRPKEINAGMSDE